MILPKHTKHFKISPGYKLNYPSLSKRLTVCTRQDLGREHGILKYVTATLDVCQVCHNVGRRVFLTKHRSESQWTVLSYDILTISTNVKCYYGVVYDNKFSFSIRQCTGASCNSPTATVQNSQLPFS